MTRWLRLLSLFARLVHGCPRWVDVAAYVIHCRCGATEGEWHRGWLWEIYRKRFERWQRGVSRW